MYVFIIGMERCGTHSLSNIIKSSSKIDSYVVHEEPPYLCREAKLIFDKCDFRTEKLKEKVRLLRSRKFELVCESNHRFGYLVPFFMREFDCKFIFLYRDPALTIVSRIGIWSYFPDYLYEYPDFFKEMLKKIPKHDFNNFRISPIGLECHSVLDLYLWEWLENYKFTRRDLMTIPRKNRLLINTDDITSRVEDILGFIGKDYFDMNIAVQYATIKTDTVYDKQDAPLEYAQRLVETNLEYIRKKVDTEIGKLSTYDSDIALMDQYLLKSVLNG